MRAWTYTDPGSPFQALIFSTTHPSPADKPLPANYVLVKVSYSGLNAGVQLIMALLPSMIHKTPAVPELDFSGIVMAIGSKIPADSTLQPGTKVFGVCPPVDHLTGGAGTLAEYVAVPAWALAPVPTGMEMKEAAALAACACTSVQVVRRADVRKGMKVLVNGGSGGLGSLMVQVVKAAVGASGVVVSTASTGKVGFVKGLGADVVHDYTLRECTPLSSLLIRNYGKEPFDVIIDAVGVQDLYNQSPAYLTKKGIFITAGGSSVVPTWSSFLGYFWTILLNITYPAFLPRGVSRRYAFLSGDANPSDLEAVTKLVEEDKLRVPIDSEWELEDALKGYERITSRAVKGKVVVGVQDH